MNCPSKRVGRGESEPCLDTLADTVRVSRDHVARHALARTPTRTVSGLVTPHIGGVSPDTATRLSTDVCQAGGGLFDADVPPGEPDSDEAARDAHAGGRVSPRSLYGSERTPEPQVVARRWLDLPLHRRLEVTAIDDSTGIVDIWLRVYSPDGRHVGQLHTKPSALRAIAGELEALAGELGIAPQPPAITNSGEHGG